ncbi:MAG: DUF167 domain-containing protein [candidate division WOR-3 bacterium]
MKISVLVKPNAKQNKVEKLANYYLIWTKEPPTENKANNAVIELLAEYFNIPKSKINIVAGFKSRKKIIELKD